MTELLDIPSTRAALGGISRSAVYDLLASSQLDKIKIGRRTLIPRASIERLIAQSAA